MIKLVSWTKVTFLLHTEWHPASFLGNIRIGSFACVLSVTSFASVWQYQNEEAS